MLSNDEKRDLVFVPLAHPAEGHVIMWLKSKGNEINKASKAIMVIESNRASMDVKAIKDGYLAKIITWEGETTKVRAVVVLIMTLEGGIVSIAEGDGGSNDATTPAPVVSAEVGPTTGG
jgi:pyruvate/2-oxoglutarate dehydrogenase complex dihydrolipoamide acyltransferase (E2) component